MSQHTVASYIHKAKALVKDVTGSRVVALLVKTDNKNRAELLNLVIAGDSRIEEDHAESLLCKVTNVCESNKTHMIVTKMPCEHCAKAIIKKFENTSFELHIPSTITFRSRWYSSQVKGYERLVKSNIEIKMYD